MTLHYLKFVRDLVASIRMFVTPSNINLAFLGYYKCSVQIKNFETSIEVHNLHGTIVPSIIYWMQAEIKFRACANIKCSLLLLLSVAQAFTYVEQ